MVVREGMSAVWRSKVNGAHRSKGAQGAKKQWALRRPNVKSAPPHQKFMKKV